MRTSYFLALSHDVNSSKTSLLIAGFCLQKIPILLMVFNQIPLRSIGAENQRPLKGIILDKRMIIQAQGEKGEK
jgi:hypothetical protein